jgi:hypothetical protein
MAKMLPSTLLPNALLRGSVFPELVKLIAVVPVGNSFKLICEGSFTSTMATMNGPG